MKPVLVIESILIYKEQVRESVFCLILYTVFSVINRKPFYVNEGSKNAQFLKS